LRYRCRVRRRYRTGRRRIAAAAAERRFRATGNRYLRVLGTRRGSGRGRGRRGRHGELAGRLVRLRGRRRVSGRR